MTYRQCKNMVASDDGSPSEKWDMNFEFRLNHISRELLYEKVAELYAQSKVSEALKLAEGLAEKEKRELWDRACMEQRGICAASAETFTDYLPRTDGMQVSVSVSSILNAPKPEYKP